jgi:hypothetical protein
LKVVGIHFLRVVQGVVCLSFCLRRSSLCHVSSELAENVAKLQKSAVRDFVALIGGQFHQFGFAALLSERLVPAVFVPHDVRLYLVFIFHDVNHSMQARYPIIIEPNIARFFTTDGILAIVQRVSSPLLLVPPSHFQ